MTDTALLYAPLLGLLAIFVGWLLRRSSSPRVRDAMSSESPIIMLIGGFYFGAVLFVMAAFALAMPE